MGFLTDNYRLTSTRQASEIPSGIDAVVYKLFGRYKARASLTSAIMHEAELVLPHADICKNMTDNALEAALDNYRRIFRRSGKDHASLLYPAMGAIAEAAYRSLGFRPFKVQIAGAIALYKGYIAEMATGEGKTLAAALTAVVRGWSGYPCHIITANDYLAQRDAENLSQFYLYCGVTSGYVISAMKPVERREGYSHDITYSTAKEVTADFLRDRLALGKLQQFERRQIRELSGASADAGSVVVTRGMHTAIVDEADSLLIDEAVTPLIISRNQPNEPFVQACMAASAIASKLTASEHYTVNIQYREIELSQSLDISSELISADIPRQFTGKGFQRELLRQALTAKELFHRDKHYVVQDGKVVIVDEFTGRTMAQRTWSAGLHQLVEAKENLPITPPSETLARLSFQRYFRFYHNLSGMTGTASESGTELWHIYRLPIVRIPLNRPSRRTVLPRAFFTDQNLKFNAIINEIAVMHAAGRPVLAGTRSVQKSEELAARLAGQGLPFRLINAIRHREEASIIAEAGKRGAITVATNMAGRGTDIILDRNVECLGGLHVISAECNESARIDRQLFGRCARQGDQGSARSFVSMDDELLRRFLNRKILRTVNELLRTKNEIALRIADKAVEHAQQNAQRRAYTSRRSVQKMDTWLQDSLSFTQGEF
jgi:preprotein translocase subunit SecA